MTRSAPAALVAFSVLAIVPSAARPPLPVAAPRVLDLRPHDVHHVGRVAFSPDSSVLAVCGSNVNAQEWEPVTTLWSAATGRHLKSFRGPRTDSQHDVSPDGKAVAASDRRAGEVIVWDATTGQELRRLKQPGARTVRFDSHGRLITMNLEPGAGVGWTFGLRVWEWGTGRELFNAPLAGEEILNTWHPSDGRVLFETNRRRIRAWNPRTGREDRPIQPEPVGEMYAVSSRGTVLVRRLEGRPATIDTASGKVQRVFGRAGQGYTLAVFLPDDEVVVAVANDNVVELWNATTGVRRSSFLLTVGTVSAGPLVTPCNDGRHLLVRWQVAPTADLPVYDRYALYMLDGRLVREGRYVTEVVFDRTGRSVAVVTQPRPAAREPREPNVTIHDAAAWLAGGSR